MSIDTDMSPATKARALEMMKEYEGTTNSFIAEITTLPNVDKRLLVIGRTQIELGFMALAKALPT